jgi:hypothetical protein
MNNNLNLLEFNWIWPSLLRLKITITKSLTEKTYSKDFLFCLLYRSAISHKCKSSCIVVLRPNSKKEIYLYLLYNNKTYVHNSKEAYNIFDLNVMQVLPIICKDIIPLYSLALKSYTMDLSCLSCLSPHDK